MASKGVSAPIVQHVQVALDAPVREFAPTPHQN